MIKKIIVIMVVGAVTCLANISYHVCDTFKTARIAGTVNGTSCEPGPGHRVVSDITGTGVFIDSFACATGDLTIGNEGFYLDSIIPRENGRVIVTEVKNFSPLASYYIGLSDAATLNQSYHLYNMLFMNDYVNAYTTSNAASTALMNGVQANKRYKIAIVLRSAGRRIFYRDTTDDWQLLYMDTRNNNLENYFAFSTFQVRKTGVRSIKCPKKLYSVLPVASDAFNRSDRVPDSTDGLGHAEGDGGADVDWTQQISGWHIVDQKLKCDSAYASIATVDVGAKDTYCSVRMTRNAGFCGFALRYKDADNYVTAYLQSDSVKIDKKIDGTTTNVSKKPRTFVAGAQLIARWTDNKLWLIYNDTLADTTSLITDAAIVGETDFGLYSTDSGNTFDDFYAFKTRGYTSLDSVDNLLPRVWNGTTSDMNLKTNYSLTDTLSEADSLIYNATSTANATATANLSVGAVNTASAYTGNWSISGKSATAKSSFTFNGTGIRNLGTGLILSGPQSSLILGSTITTLTASSCNLQFSSTGHVLTDNKGMSAKSLTVGTSSDLVNNGSSASIYSSATTPMTISDNGSLTLTRGITLSCNGSFSPVSLGNAYTITGASTGNSYLFIASGANNATLTIPAMSVSLAYGIQFQNSNNATGTVHNFNGAITNTTGRIILDESTGNGSCTFNTNNWPLTAGTIISIGHTVVTGTGIYNLGTSLLSAPSVVFVTASYTTGSSTINSSTISVAKNGAAGITKLLGKKITNLTITKTGNAVDSLGDGATLIDTFNVGLLSSGKFKTKKTRTVWDSLAISTTAVGDSAIFDTSVSARKVTIKASAKALFTTGSSLACHWLQIAAGTTLTLPALTIGGTPADTIKSGTAGVPATFALTGNVRDTIDSTIVIIDMTLEAGDTVYVPRGINGGGNSGAWIWPSTGTRRARGFGAFRLRGWGF
jgi:hypothetical protein